MIPIVIVLSIAALNMIEATHNSDLVMLHFADSYRFHMYGSEFAKTIRHVHDAEAAAGNHVVVLHSGDVFFGCGLCNRGNGSHITEIFRYLNVRFMCPGNHEMDQGLSQFRDILYSLVPQTRIVLSNVSPSSSSTTWWWHHEIPENPFTLVYEHADMIIGPWHIRIIGLWDTSTWDTIGSEIRNELIIQNPIDVAIRLCDEGREQSHSPSSFLCICLTHMENETDIRLAESHACDYVLGGHDHSWFSSESLHLVKTGTDLHDLAVIRVLQEKEPSHMLWSLRRIKREEMISFGCDESFRTLVTHNMEQVDMRPICHLIDAMPVHTLRSRLEQTYLGQWVALQLHESTMHMYGTQAGVVNSGYIRAEHDMQNGTLTYAQLEEWMPFNDEVVCVSCLPPMLTSLFEKHTSGLPNIENGHYPQIYGLYIEVDTSSQATRLQTRVTSMWLLMPYDTMVRINGPDSLIQHIRLGIRIFDHGYLFESCTLCSLDHHDEQQVYNHTLSFMHSIFIHTLTNNLTCPFYKPYTPQVAIATKSYDVHEY